MPSVASQANHLPSPANLPSARNRSDSDAKSPSSPFAMLLDEATPQSEPKAESKAESKPASATDTGVPTDRSSPAQPIGQSRDADATTAISIVSAVLADQPTATADNIQAPEVPQTPKANAVTALVARMVDGTDADAPPEPDHDDQTQTGDTSAAQSTVQPSAAIIEAPKDETGKVAAQPAVTPSVAAVVPATAVVPADPAPATAAAQAAAGIPATTGSATATGAAKMRMPAAATVRVTSGETAGADQLGASPTVDGEIASADPKSTATPEKPEMSEDGKATAQSKDGEAKPRSAKAPALAGTSEVTFKAVQSGQSNDATRPDLMQIQNPATAAGATATASGVSASPTPQAQTQAQVQAQAVPLPGLAIEIVREASAGRHRFEIRLDPPELGRIDVRLDVGSDGQVSTRLVVDRAETLDLLKRDATDLQRALQQAGLKTSDNALEFSLRQHAFGREDTTPQAATQVVVPDDDPTPLDAMRQGYGRLLGLGGGLDIRV